MITTNLSESQPQKEPGAAPAGKGTAFRWHYVIAPLGLLLVSLVTAAIFYPRLPAEVAYHFSAGAPDAWLKRTTTLTVLLAPQLRLALVALATVWGVTRLRSFTQAGGNALVKPEYLLWFMGNAFALPQLVLFFTTLDIFSYNAYQQHILPLWLLLLGTVGLATLALGVLLILLIRKAGQQATAPIDNTTKE